MVLWYTYVICTNLQTDVYMYTYTHFGRLLHGSNDGTEVREDELVCRPCSLAANSSAGMWSALKAVLPDSLWKLLQGVTSEELVALTPGSDQFSACQMMIEHLTNCTGSAADRIFVLPGWCHQHKSGNSLQTVTQKTGILRPEFCLARRLKAEKFKKRFREGMRVALRLSLKHIKGSENPGWQPEQSHLDHARTVLELFYFKKDIRNSRDPEDPEQQRTLEDLRRKRGEALLKRFQGDWRKKDIAFFDPSDEFGSFDEAVHEATRLLEVAGFEIVGDPAENKWLSVWPVNQTLGMMQSFHFVFLFALRYACGVQGNEVEDAAMRRHEDETVGVLSSDAWHKLERRRELRALSWAEERSSAFSVALFSFIGEKCIRHHFRFFKHAQQSPFGDDESIIFALCRPNNFIQKSVDELWGLLESDDDWKPVATLFGAFASWAPKWRLMAVECVKCLIGVVAF